MAYLVMTMPKDLAGRVVDVLVGRPLVWVGRRVERRAKRRVRRAVPALPEPPAWLAPFLPFVGITLLVIVELVQQVDLPVDDGSRRSRERAEPEAERCPDPTETDDAVREALETLEVEYPPMPPQEDVEAAYRERVKETHPDAGGDAEEFIAVREAWERVENGEELRQGTEDMEVTKQS